MKALKIFGITLLSLLLFLSLSVFGFAFMLNNTALNPDFVVSELDKLDIPLLAEEFISQEIPEEELRATLTDTITKLEPQIKEQVGAAIYTVYDYLLGKSENLDLAATLGDTILSSDFVGSIVDNLNISSLAGEFISEQFTGQIPEELQVLTEYVDDVTPEMEPWLKEQASVAAAPILDYLLGESQSLSVVISLEPVMENLEDNLRGAFLESPPPELVGLPMAELERYFDEYFQELAEVMPSTLEIDESLLGTEIPSQIAETLAEAEEALAQSRQYVGYFQTGYYVLIGFMLLLILGIILINRQVRWATRGLGITFLTYGALWYGGIFAGKHFAGTQGVLSDIPAQFQTLLPPFLNDSLAPLGMFSLGLLIAGVALIIVSVVYKPRQPSD